VSLSAAEAYEAFLVPALFRPWADMVVSAHPPAVATRVLDVACGTGIGARLAARMVGAAGAVVGLDTDQAMLAVARATPRAADDAPIEWLQGDAGAMPFDSATFDYVVCLEGIRFFEDRRAGLREVRRVLRPGGRLVASIWSALSDNPGYAALAEGLRTFVSDTAADLPPLSLGDAEEVRGLISSAGFTEARVSAATLTFTVPSAEAFIDWLAAGGPTIRRNLAQLPEARRVDFTRLVSDRLERYRTKEGLSLPSTRNVVTGTASAG
jgi:SAM-dependent methyltransferase